VSKNVTVSANTGSTELGGNTFKAQVSVTGNTVTVSDPDGATAVEIEANTITKDLACSTNAPGVTNDSKPNTVSGARSGQCGAAVVQNSGMTTTSARRSQGAGRGEFARLAAIVLGVALVCVSAWLVLAPAGKGEPDSYGRQGSCGSVIFPHEPYATHTEVCVD